MSAEQVPDSPLVVNWALTNRCNFACRHCYSRGDPDGELEFEVVCAIGRKLAEARVFSVNFGGGEPLLRQDLPDVARHLRELGLAVTMSSNGFLVDASCARRLREAGLSRVSISIDSPRPEVHDAFRGVAGSHARALAALAHLRTTGIETSVSAVVCRINVDDVEALVELAAHAGARSVSLHNFKCTGLGHAHRDALDLTPAEWRRFYVAALGLRELYGELEISFDEPMLATLGQRNGAALVKGSVCGKLSLSLKANGDVTPCGFIPLVIGNLLRDDLGALWRQSPLLARLRHKERRGKCVACDSYDDCLGGCSARALALTGAIDNPDPHCWQHESS